MTTTKTYVFKMITNRKGRPISVFINNRSEQPNVREFEGYYVDPVDGSPIEIDLGGSWLQGTGNPSPDAFEVKLKKIG